MTLSDTAKFYERGQDQSNMVNVAARLTAMAAARGEQTAVVETAGREASGRCKYRSLNFSDLEADSNRLAGGLTRLGVAPGVRIALLVRPGIDFVSLVFALLKTGAVSILIDPGMGRKNLLRCLDDARPAGFVAISAVQAVRTLLGRRFNAARLNVTVGRRWFWGGPTLADLRRDNPAEFTIARTLADDPAAIIFTTGSTGPPKGVHYTQRIFDRQVCEIRDQYGIAAGEVDLPCFPLFGLFNAAMGVTTVIPDMDPSRPARVDPRRIIEAAADWQATQSFGSPAIWNRVGRYCEQHGARLPSVRRVLSAGAPVPAEVLRRMKACIYPAGEMHTPYGATEALPVATIAAGEVLGETAEKTASGAGVCVGRKFPGIRWKVIRIVDGPIAELSQIDEMPPGEIGELIVVGEVVTRQYVTRVEANAMAKIADGADVWHRMGDVGYFDTAGRFWFCGRLAHRVLTAAGPLYTIPCEAIFNQHPDVFRSALVGIGPRGGLLKKGTGTSRLTEPGRIATPGSEPVPSFQQAAGNQWPVIVAEPHAGRFPHSKAAQEKLFAELRVLGRANSLTQTIDTFLVHRSLPVDIRHNAKIFREQLAAWATRKLGA